MIETENIFEITNSVFSTMLDLQCEMGEPTDETTNECLSTDHVVGCIHISGGWNGVIQLMLTADSTAKAASQMLQIATEDVTHDDIIDTVSELTNMVGGGIKGVLPGPSFLSLPSLTSGDDFNIRIPGAALLQSVGFQCEGQPMTILMHQSVA